jgi:uncharacterized membrane protein
MNSPILGLRIASVVFGLISLGQLLRILFHIQVIVGSHLVGRRWSAIVVILTAGLCAWLWSLTCCQKDKAPAVEP